MRNSFRYFTSLVTIYWSLVTFSHAVPIHVTYLWHMHQPIYYPYETVQQTVNAGRYPFDLYGIFSARTGPYTTWPKEAVEQGINRAGLEHSGVQVSFSGSLAENLNNLWGDAGSASWDDAYDYGVNTLRTSLNNPRLDLVAFPYHHSLMPLTCPESRRMQIRLHKEVYAELWNGASYSKGMFPAECAFADWIVPDLVNQGINWVIVDNIHFDRACQTYPWNSGGNVYRPNAADQINPAPPNWVQLNGVWAPTKVSAPFGYQPHYVQYVDPNSSLASPVVTRMIAVPAARYEGNENARGGYGAFKPQNVWTGSLLTNNPDANHPMLMLCHSDGDNYGMLNSDAYHAQHGAFLDMCQANADFDNTSVQDYLQLYPPASNDVIHVEPGSWSGADNGDPEFKKWFADNSGNAGQNPDRFSWSVLIAAQNRVILADTLENTYTMNDVQWGIGADTAKAWHYYLNAEASDYWYWDSDTSAPWNGNVTRACNMAITEADKVLARHPGVDIVGPSIFEPQREPYNPGGHEWNEVALLPSDFEVLTYVYDSSGLTNVALKWRADNDGFNPESSIQNEIYDGGPEVGAWQSVAMNGSFDPANKGPGGDLPDPAARAQTYKAMVTGQSNVLLDYYVEAYDTQGNRRRSNIKHVFVGTAVAGPIVQFSPAAPQVCNLLTITYNSTNRPLQGATNVNVQIDWEPSVSPPSAPAMALSNGLWRYTTAIPADQTNVVVWFHNGAGTFDDNGAQFWRVAIATCSTGAAPVVSFNPPAPNGCSNVLVSFSPNFGPLKNSTNIYIHIGRNGWQDVAPTNPLMAASGTGTWTYVYSPPDGTYKIDCAFNDGQNIWDNNQNSDYHINVTNCGSAAQAITAVYGHLVVSDDPTNGPDQNNVGDNFDFNTAGGTASTINQGGFGNFGQIYVNFDETNFYIGARGVDMVGNNNAMIVLLSFNTLGDNANNLWDKTGLPRGLDQLHNVWINNPGADIAILLGDEYGDGQYPNFGLGNGYDMGQGVFYLSATSFVQVAGAKLSQFDGLGTTATTTNDGDGNRLTDRWECSIPWGSLTATGVDSIAQCHLAGLIVSDGTNGVDRYLSGNYLAYTATPATNGNYGFGFVTLTPLSVALPNTDSDSDGLPDWWEIMHYGGTAACARDVDNDGDGFRNWEEFQLGTQPTNIFSTFVVDDEGHNGGGHHLTWLTVGGKTYLVDCSDNLMNGFSNIAQVVEDDVAAGVPSTETYVDSAATGAVRAYRVRLAP